jgi:hypothetical protein
MRLSIDAESRTRHRADAKALGDPPQLVWILVSSAGQARPARLKHRLGRRSRAASGAYRWRAVYAPSAYDWCHRRQVTRSMGPTERRLPCRRRALWPQGRPPDRAPRRGHSRGSRAAARACLETDLMSRMSNDRVCLSSVVIGRLRRERPTDETASCRLGSRIVLGGEINPSGIGQTAQHFRDRQLGVTVSLLTQPDRRTSLTLRPRPG